METKLKKVKPALYNLSGTKWHWVFLSELASILKWDPRKVFETYRDLASVMWAGYGGWRIGPLHWATENGPCCNGENPHKEPTNFEYLLVPAGWSERVLIVFNYGVIRLGRKICWNTSPAQDGTILKFFIRPEEKNEQGDSMAIIGYSSLSCDITAYLGYNHLPLFREALSVRNPGLPV